MGKLSDADNGVVNPPWAPQQRVVYEVALRNCASGGAEMRKWYLVITITLMILATSISCIQSRPPAPSTVPGPSSETKSSSSVSSPTPKSQTPQTTSPQSQPTQKEPRQGVIFLNDSSYKGSDGYLHVIGEVKNDTNGNVGQIKVTASLLDQQRKPYMSIGSLAYLSLLEPGQRSPFDVIFQGVTADTNEYQLDLSWETTTATSKTKLQIRQTSNVDRDGFYWLNGEVYNAGNQKAEDILLVGAFYDNNGKIVAVGIGFPDVVPLSAGESSPFSLAVENPEKKITGSLIQAEAY